MKILTFAYIGVLLCGLTGAAETKPVRFKIKKEITEIWNNIKKEMNEHVISKKSSQEFQIYLTKAKKIDHLFPEFNINQLKEKNHSFSWSATREI